MFHIKNVSQKLGNISYLPLRLATVGEIPRIKTTAACQPYSQRLTHHICLKRAKLDDLSQSTFHIRPYKNLCAPSSRELFQKQKNISKSLKRHWQLRNR